MANNLVVQLLLKTGTFSTDLKQARGQIQNFQQGCQTAGKTVTQMGNALGVNIGALTKLGTAAGAAVVAVKGFKSVMESTQTTSDRLDDAIAGVRGVVEALKVSLATADFSNFKNGLWDIFDGAVNARRALDDLADARLGYGMISSKNRAEFSEAQNDYREAIEAAKNAKTKEERDKFLAEAEMYKKMMEEYVKSEEEAARNFKYDTMNAIKTDVHQRNHDVNVKDVTEAAIMEAARILNSGPRKDDEKKAAKKRAENWIKDTKGMSDPKKWQYLNNRDAQFDLAVATLIEFSDKRIEQVAKELEEGNNAQLSAQSMRRSYDRTIKGSGIDRVTTPRGGTTAVQKEELAIQEGSLTYWRNILKEETTYRDALDENTDAWKEHNEKVKAAKAMIDAIEERQVESVTYIEGSAAYYEKMKSDAQELLKTLEPFSDEYMEQERLIKEIDKTINEIDLVRALNTEPQTISNLEKVVALIKELKDNAAIGSERFHMWSDMLDVAQKELDQAKGVKPEIKAPDTSQWDKFNQSMSNTATIVSSLSSTFKEGAEVTAASVLQMVATCLPAIGSLISSLSALTVTEAVEAGTAAVGKAVSTSKHWIEAIAAVASLGAVVAAAIAAASKPSTKKYATGGIVGGNSFYGDRVPAMVNSGEMILNRSQQARLFQMANSGSTGGQVEFHISGTELVGVLSNVNRKNRVIR